MAVALSNFSGGGKLEASRDKVFNNLDEAIILLNRVEEVVVFAAVLDDLFVIAHVGPYTVLGERGTSIVTKQWGGEDRLMGGEHSAV